MICAAPRLRVWRWSGAPKRRLRRLPDTAFATCVRSSMHITCTAIRRSPRPPFASLKSVMPKALAQPKPEQNLQNDRQNGVPSPTAKGGKSEQRQLAGELGFEPRLTESESAVLPLNYSPSMIRKSGNRFSEKIMLHQEPRAIIDSS